MVKPYIKPSPMGRPLSAENLATLRSILQMARRKPGIPNSEVAQKLSLRSLHTGVLAKRLVAQGELEIRRSGRALCLFPVDEKK